MFGIVGLVILVLDVIALVSLLKSSADSGTKILWALLIILLPVVGMILYFLMGPGRRKVI
ncbi:MAG TPA: PLDc N-terminal domain-containing protein [Thermoanaerobaculia bacterium]